MFPLPAGDPVALSRQSACGFVAVRVTDYTEPDPDPVDPEYGSGARTIADVTVDAFVVDLERHDVPCAFTAHGDSLGFARWTTGTAREAIYKDIQTSLALDIDDHLRDLAARHAT